MVTRTASRPVRKVGLSLDLQALLAFIPDLSGERDAIIAELTQVFLNAYAASAPNIAIDTAMRDRAAQFALERSWEAIEEVNNATRNEVRELVSAAVQDGLSIGQLRSALQSASMFSRNRAQTIAVTETAYALGRGQRAAALDMQQDQQSWVAEGDACDTCLENEADGWIGIDEAYSGGDDGIPSHPRCRCTVIYRTRRVHEESVTVPLVKEVHCPECGRWVGRNLNVGGMAYCPTHKAVRVTA